MDSMEQDDVVNIDNTNKKKRKFVFIALGILLIAGGAFFLRGKFFSPSYEELYTLVPDKISQSAAIAVRLPEGILFDVAEASSKIKFEPELTGSWSTGKNTSELVFRPQKKLELGKYYTVALVTDDIRLEKDFLADEDPKIVSVFPAENSETSEYSSVTIVFNRPMVPLTTLDTLSTKDIPVEITPATEGRFKWITTRNLQFIPASRLKRSSNYKVRIKPGFVSTDGLPVDGGEYTFITRPLRYEKKSDYNYSTGAQNKLYHEPIRILFNQPIDLEKTKGEVTLIRAGGARIDFVASYGVRSIYNEETKKSEKKLDKSIMEIYQKADRHGRERFWDFNNSYSITLAKAYPLDGDIELKEEFKESIKTSEIIEGLSAESSRTRLASPDLFDPEGSLAATFFEDIDKDASTIRADALRDISYGEKCREPEVGEEVVYSKDCTKVPDYKKLIMKFDASDLRRGQAFSLEFRKIYNRAGLKLNAETITKTIKVYPELTIYKTLPTDGADGADLTSMVICSSSPLAVPDEKTFYERVKSNVTVGLWNWYPPQRIDGISGRATFCDNGQFENTIHYGLVPEFSYNIALNLVDDFGQTASKTLRFKSTKLSAFSRTFYHMQGQYNVTSPDRTKLTFATDNMEYVDVQICRISPETMLSYLGEGRPSATVAPGELNCTNTIQKRIDLPKKYWSRNYFQFNLRDYISEPLGHFVITFSHPDLRRVHREWDYDTKSYKDIVGERIYEKTFLTVTRLALQEKKVERTEYGSFNNLVDAASPKNLYWVTEFGSLNAVADALVDLYDKHQKLGSARTGNDGIALADTFENLRGAIVRKGLDSAVVFSDVDRLQWSFVAMGTERTYLYTDRPIYRPGNIVHVKGIYRIGFDAKYEIFRDKKANIEIRDSQYKTVSKQNVDVSDYGTFTLDFTLDQNAPLGSYSISALDGYASFDVEEYVPAAFNVSVGGDKEEYIAGETAKLDVSAEYYFGVPVEGGTVEYSLASQQYFFDRFRDGYFNFGGDWYSMFDGYYGDRFLLRGKAPLGKNGRATIEQKLDFNTLFKDDERNKSKIFTFDITIRNKNGQAISSQKSFIVHRGEVYLGASLDKSFVSKGEKITARIKTVDTGGKEVSQSDILLEIKKISWESYKRREVDGNYYYRTEQKKETVSSATLRTDRNGNASYEFALDKAGEYEIVASAKDSRENTIVATHGLFVSGDDGVSIRPTNNETLDLATDKSQLDVGEKATIIIKSPFKRAKALVTLERGKIFEHHVINVNDNLANFTFEVKEEYIPNVFASVILLSPDPEVKFGQIQYRVNTKEREVDVSIRTDKNNYLPGETIKLFVDTKDRRGNSIETEVSLAVVDMSVLALKGNPKKNPVMFFYSGTPLAVSTASNIKNILQEADIPAGTKGGSGGAGSSVEDLAKKKRGEFKDTAFWQGVVRTSKDGKAEISFKLPDNLTTWQIESVGLTRDTKVGAGYREFKTQKNVMVVPLKPRFIVPGDEFFVGAKIFNETENRQKLNVELSSKTLVLTGKRSLGISLDPHENMTVYFPATAPDGIKDGAHLFEISAKNSDYEDTVAESIKITRNNTYEAVATAAYTNAKSAREYIYLPPNVVADRGGVEIKSSATLAVFLSDALNYLVEYPYGSSEQIASKLGALGILKRGLNLKNIGDAFQIKEVEFQGQRYTPDDVVRIGLARLFENQGRDGGFAYYKSMRPDLYLTIHVLNALVDLKNAGYAVDASRINQAATFIERELKTKKEYSQSKDLVVLSAYSLSRVDGFVTSSDISVRVANIARDKAFVNEKISNTSLAYLAIFMASGSYPADLKEEIFKILENRLVIDSRGASLRPQGAGLWQFYETPIKDTALFIKAMAKDRRENPVLDKALRWVLRSRDKDGAWGSSNNTVAVIDAFTDFMLWKKENESQFDLSVALDGAAGESFSFNKDTILKTFQKFISVGEIGLGKIRKLEFQKTDKNSLANNYYYDVSLKYYLPVDKIPPRDEGFSVSREFYKVDDEKRSEPMHEAMQGDVLRARLTITVPITRNFVAVEDYIPAGMEIINFRLATEDQSLKDSDQDYEYNDYYEERGSLQSLNFASIGSWFGGLFGGGSTVSQDVDGEIEDDFYGREMNVITKLYPSAEELHDDRAFLFTENLSPGVYEYEYFVRALVPGTFHHLPAVVSEMYFPENFGRTRGDKFIVKEAD